MPATQLGVSIERLPPGHFCGVVPAPPGFGNFRQGLAVGADLLGQRTVFLCFLPGTRPLSPVSRSVRPMPGADRVGPVRVFRDVCIAQLVSHVRRCPRGFSRVGAPSGPQLTIAGGRDRRPSSGIRRAV